MAPHSAINLLAKKKKSTDPGFPGTMRTAHTHSCQER
jgi:hypothetical protein